MKSTFIFILLMSFSSIHQIYSQDAEIPVLPPESPPPESDPSKSSANDSPSPESQLTPKETNAAEVAIVVDDSVKEVTPPPDSPLTVVVITEPMAVPTLSVEEAYNSNPSGGSDGGQTQTTTSQTPYKGTTPKGSKGNTTKKSFKEKYDAFKKTVREKAKSINPFLSFPFIISNHFCLIIKEFLDILNFDLRNLDVRNYTQFLPFYSEYKVMKIFCFYNKF